jgi:molecular chaperone DnaK
MEKMQAFESATDQLKKDGRKTPAFGIDLGTTNSAIAVVQAGETPEVISLEGGAKTLPSCVMWKGPKGGFVVGKEAYNNRYKKNAIYSVKRMMGTDDLVKLTYGSKTLELTPAEVSAEILKDLIRQASTRYKDIKDVVITVPAYFDNKQVSDTLEAGNLAGLNVLYIMREPTAASLCYQTDFSGRNDEKILVYDFGGGTFDVSVLRISKSGGSEGLADFYGFEDKSSSLSNVVYTVLDTDGDSHLGGDDVDKALYNIVEGKISDLGFDITQIPVVEKEKIILRLEKLKKSMKGSGTSGSLALNFKLLNGTKLKKQIHLMEQDFRDATSVIYKKTREKVKAVLSRTESSEISSIVLVGGSTKSVFLRDMIKRDFPKVNINNALNPDESVALGASIKAKETKFGDTKTEVFDILPLAIGVLSDGAVNPVIRKNQRVPFNASKFYSTVEDNQESIQIPVYQGNSSIKEECLYLGELRMDKLPKGKAHEVAIKVVMIVDTNGLLKIKVTVGDLTKEVELVNLFGQQSKQVLSLSDKRILKWKAFADRLSDAPRKEVLEAVDNYSRGEITLEEVSSVVSKHTVKKTEVIKPSLKVQDYAHEEE